MDVPEGDSRQLGEARGPGERLRGWALGVYRRLSRRRVAVFGVALSLFVHAMLLVVSAVLILHRPVPSLGSPDAEVELAVITESELTEMMRGELETVEPEMDELEEPEAVSPERFDSPVTIADLSSLSEVDAVTGLAGSGASRMGGADSFGSAEVTGGSAKFFGVEARGSRFCYLVDVSGSMAGERIAALKRALEASIDGLLEQAHFSVILYSSGAMALTDGRWVPATDRHKLATYSQIRAIDPSGATNPWPAFEIAFAMKPRPDAIYFMTDGQIHGQGVDEMVAWIARTNREAGMRTQIHCITFVHQDDQTVSLMRRIARQSGGTYTHVEGSG